MGKMTEKIQKGRKIGSIYFYSWIRFYLLAGLVLLICGTSRGQFYTLKKVPKTVIIKLEKNNKENNQIKDPETVKTEPDSILEVINYDYEKSMTKDSYRKARKKPKRNNKTVRTHDLTITALWEEINRNKIQHPKIVLAQAILETGWFTSNVCHNKGNLFGLTNPRTGEYYEFDDWRDSVKAYYSKVQYRYKPKDGNYLLWLKKIGYAEDPRYIHSLIRIIEQHLIINNVI